MCVLRMSAIPASLLAAVVFLSFRSPEVAGDTGIEPAHVQRQSRMS